MGLNYPKDQGTEWMNLKQQVKNAFTSANSRVPYQKIAAGVLKVASSLEVLAGAFFKFFYANGETGIRMGRFTLGDSQEYEGFFVNKYGNHFGFSSYNRVSDGYNFTAIYDGSGKIVVSDDAVAAKGLATPWIPITFANTTELASPPAARTTTNTTDTAIISTIAPVQHPKMYFWGYVYTSVGTDTVEVKFKNITNGTTMYASTQGSGFLSGVFALGDFDPFDNHQIDVTVRRASGSGTVGFTLLSLTGRQS